MISNNLKKRIYTSLILLLLIILIMNFNFVMVYSLILLGVISTIEFLNITNKIFKKKFFTLISNIFFIVFIFTFCFCILYFSNFIQLKIILFILLSGCIASDIGGFVIGKIIKGPKLTKISPNKTISGSIGSLVFTIITISSLMFFYLKHFDFKIIIVSLVVSLTCQLGDLFFSVLKRKAEIKDTGNFLPGHGGFLDRLDGIFFGLPSGYLTLIYLY